jgi:hypothetical protein
VIIAKSFCKIGTASLILRAFFHNSFVKRLTPILIPGALAAALLHILGPVVAGTAAAVAIKNSLALLHIDMTNDTIEKFLKPGEGMQRH